MQTNELNEMREQMELLKQKIEHEKQLGEKQIRRAMRKEMAKINRQGWSFVILALAAVPFFIWSRNVLPVSEPFCWFTCAFLFVAALYTHLIHSELSAEDLNGEHLLSVARKLTNLKRSYNRWLYFSIPVVMVWILWYVHELRVILRPEIFLPTMICCAVGGLIGLAIGLHKRRVVQRSCSELLVQIREMTNEE